MIDLRNKWNIFKCLSFIQFIGKNELIIKIDKLNKDSIKGITISLELENKKKRNRRK